MCVVGYSILYLGAFQLVAIKAHRQPTSYFWHLISLLVNFTMSYFVSPVRSTLKTFTFRLLGSRHYILHQVTHRLVGLSCQFNVTLRYGQTLLGSHY